MRKTLNIDDILNKIVFDTNKAVEDKEYGNLQYANMRLNVASKLLDALDTLLDREQKSYYNIKSLRDDIESIREQVSTAQFHAKMDAMGIFDDQPEVA